jgi:hypothetical protein
MGRFVASPEASAKTSGNDGEPRPLAGEVLVDWQGVQRRVRAEDLVKAAMEAEATRKQAESLAEAARATLIRNEAVAALAKRYESMTPDARRAFIDFSNDPSRWTPKGKVEEDPFLEAPQPSSRVPDEVLSRLDALEKGFQTAATILTDIGTERRTQTITQRVDEMMAQLPIFGMVPPAVAATARNAVMTKLAADPRRDIEPLVLEAARQANEIHQSYPENGVVTRVRPTSQNAGQEPPKFSGNDLLGGKVLQAVRDQMRR